MDVSRDRAVARDKGEGWQVWVEVHKVRGDNLVSREVDLAEHQFQQPGIQPHIINRHTFS